MQDPFYHCIKYGMTHLVAAGKLNSILALNFDKWLCTDAFLDASVPRIDYNPKFFELIMMREMDPVADMTGSDKPSNSHDRRRSTPPPQKTTPDPGSNSSKVEERETRAFV